MRVVEAAIVTPAAVAAQRLRHRRLAVASAVLLGVLLIGGASLRLAKVGRAQPQTSLGSGPSAFAGLARLLAELGYDVARHRQTYGRLPPPESAVLLILDPLREKWLQQAGVPLGSSIGRELSQWLQRGGRAVVAIPGRTMVQTFGVSIWLDAETVGDAPGADAPWSAAVAGAGLEPRWSQTMAPLRPAAGRAATPPTAALDPAAALLLPGSVEAVDGGIRVPVFAAAADAIAGQDEAPVVVEVARGAGRLVVCSSPLWLTNAALGRYRAAPFAVGLLHELSDGGRRRIVFDEYAHGMFVHRGLWWWIEAGNLGAPFLALIVLVGLLGWRGGVRLGPLQPPADRPRRAVEEFVVGLADLARRGGRHRGAALRLVHSHAVEARRRGRADHEHALATLGDTIAAAPTFGAAELVAAAARIDAIVDDRRPVSAEDPVT